MILKTRFNVGDRVQSSLGSCFVVGEIRITALDSLLLLDYRCINKDAQGVIRYGRWCAETELSLATPANASSM